MENRKYESLVNFREVAFRRSIRWIEQRLDVDFMPTLEPLDADALEGPVREPFR